MWLLRAVIIFTKSNWKQPSWQLRKRHHFWCSWNKYLALFIWQSFKYWFCFDSALSFLFFLTSEIEREILHLCSVRLKNAFFWRQFTFFPTFSNLHQFYCSNAALLKDCQSHHEVEFYFLELHKVFSMMRWQLKRCKFIKTLIPLNPCTIKAEKEMSY